MKRQQYVYSTLPCGICTHPCVSLIKAEADYEPALKIIKGIEARFVVLKK